jgi:hypothetical protein
MDWTRKHTWQIDQLDHIKLLNTSSRSIIPTHPDAFLLNSFTISDESVKSSSVDTELSAWQDNIDRKFHSVALAQMAASYPTLFPACLEPKWSQQKVLLTAMNPDFQPGKDQ